MNKELTNQTFWEKYWRSKKITRYIHENYPFYDLFQRELGGKKYKTMVEIGGFPGYYAIYFHKFWKYKTTLLDYVVDLNIINKLLESNKLDKEKIDIVKEDFNKYNRTKKYDVVFSLGFIEHFEDTEQILKKHWRMVNKGGKMIIGIPNFLGINGIYQLLFDPSNLNIHNLNSMNIVRLRNMIDDIKPKNSRVFYVSSALVWLENLEKRNIILPVLTYLLNIIGLILTRFGIRGKYISTHIFIVAEK